MYGGSSNPGNQAAGPLAMAMTASTSTNNIGDILANSKMVIHWGVDTAVRSYAGNRQLLYLKQFQQAGIKQVVIDPFYNDTAALFGAQWIPIVPNTDEALLAAITYVWFTNNLISDSFAAAHVYGYTQFKNYVLGTSDGIAKTPPGLLRSPKCPQRQSPSLRRTGRRCELMSCTHLPMRRRSTEGTSQHEANRTNLLLTTMTIDFLILFVTEFNPFPVLHICDVAPGAFPHHTALRSWHA